MGASADRRGGQVSTTSADTVTIRVLDASHADTIFALHNTVYEQVGDDTIYRGRDYAHIVEVFAPDAMCFGAFLNGALVGYSSVRFPGAGHQGLSALLGFTPARIPLLAEFDASCVLPASRGLGLQALLIEVRARASLMRGRPLSLAIVGPRNVYSLRNFLAYGMRGVALHRLPTGEDRFVMARDHSDSQSRAVTRRERFPIDRTHEDIQAVLRSGGQLDRVVREGETWLHEFVWPADVANERSWVETFEARDFFTA